MQARGMPDSGRRQVLVIDDEEHLRVLVRAALEPDFVVIEAPNGRAGLRAFYREQPDLVVLDAQMPEMDGWQTLSRIRDLSDIPIIMLTAFGGDRDIIRGLRGGADEYVTKPVSPRVLAARVESALERAARSRPRQTHRLDLDRGNLVIDRAAGRVWARGEEVHLSATEYRLLVCLAEHAGQVLSPAQILRIVWGPEYAGEVQYVKTYVRLLRSKIEADPRQPRYILARRGLGYLLSHSHAE